ncbi:DUF2270 domain-containing protein [Geopsychrobacter electrodiphilus]|uniref:DUF2270 domain-containing protein n=1 Tax=Geopsychrobacter electrodiphilus TaxID=225196 RepID=UPI00037B10D3|nr:DUF2270 domain-containing protein [Geopsychrobacter electrodiphilus]
MTDEKLTHSETVTALAHYYRAEVQRSLAWRERLDRTTNWAVAACAAFLGFGFSHPEIPHLFFLFGLGILYLLLFIEARRFRFYDAYEYRVRLMNQNMFYSILSKGTLPLDPSGDEGVFWRAELASDLRYPQYKMSLHEALTKRLRANYIYLFIVMIAGWVLKLASHPTGAHRWQEFLDHARIGPLPGLFTLLFLLVFLLHLFYLARRGRNSSGGREILHS